MGALYLRLWILEELIVGWIINNKPLLID